MEGDAQLHVQWLYRSEGNCNIVLYNKKLGRVYRILKVTQNMGQGQDADKYIQRHYSKLIQYSACVMDRFFLDFISVPLMRSVDVEFLKSLATTIKHQRPGKRLSKSLSLCPMVLDIPDYAFLPTSHRNHNQPSFMFELKPGCVARTYTHLLVDDDFFDESMRCSAQHAYCYYCLNKQEELKASSKGMIKRVSRYCPRELFSGNGKRMKRALHNILEDINCSRNKLRVFKDGIDMTSTFLSSEDLIDFFSNHIRCKKSNMLDELSDVLLASLTRSKPAMRRRGSVPLQQLPVYRSELSDSMCLPPSCILSVFASAQYYGAGDLEEVQMCYDKLKKHIEDYPEVEERLCINGPYDTGMWRLSVRPERPAGVSEDIMSAFVTVRDYLIYRTAKDCSILITMQPQKSPNSSGDERHFNENVFSICASESDNIYTCNVSIVDLDPKPYSRMQEYLSKEFSLQQTFIDTHNVHDDKCLCD